MGKTAKTDERITKRRVTMTNGIAKIDANGDPYVETHVATDYVNPELLDAYVADAQTRWMSVVVSDEPDAGPGGYDGATHVPAGLDHPEAGTVRAATKES